MSTDLELPGKWRITAHQSTLVLKKRPLEKSSHVVMKGLLWAMYLPSYPELKVEVPIGHRYKPDLVALDDLSEPVFWGEAGAVAKRKVYQLCRSFKHTHLVFAKWGAPSKHVMLSFEEAARSGPRKAPVELHFFPEDSRERFVSERGEIAIEPGDVPRFVWD